MILQQDYGGIHVRNNFEESGQYYNITSLTVSNNQQVMVSIPICWIIKTVMQISMPNFQLDDMI